jgi:hypothetical protein
LLIHLTPASSTAEMASQTSQNNNETNWEQCIELHNAIWQIGWDALETTDVEQDFRTWWEYHSAQTNLDHLQSRLNPQLVHFLKSVHYQNPGNLHDSSFFFFMSGLNRPDGLFHDPRWIKKIYSYENDQLVFLYLAPQVDRFSGVIV